MHKGFSPLPGVWPLVEFWFKYQHLYRVSSTIKGVSEWMGHGQGYTLLCPADWSEDAFRGQPVCPLDIYGFLSFAPWFLSYCCSDYLLFMVLFQESHSFRWGLWLALLKWYDTSLIRMKELYSESSYSLYFLPHKKQWSAYSPQSRKRSRGHFAKSKVWFSHLCHEHDNLDAFLLMWYQRSKKHGNFKNAKVLEKVLNYLADYDLESSSP